MALFDLLGRSWCMGVLWQSVGVPYTFRELQELCDNISPTVLNTRIKDLCEVGLLERTIDGYILTNQGNKLIELLNPFDQYSANWAKEVFDYSNDSL